MTKVITFGCRLNFYESDKIKAILGPQDDVIVINSCAVTNESERQVQQRIRKCHRENPEKKIVVVGCAAQLNPHKYSAIEGVWKVLGNAEKLEEKNYLTEDKVLVGDISKMTAIPHGSGVFSFQDRSRAFLEIQNGCNHDCTFCAITIARGKNRSIPKETIISEITRMVNSGIPEVVLTGVDITDYGKDLYNKYSFTDLLKCILREVKDLQRLRLSSVDVAELDQEFIGLVANERRLMPHLHISLQSGDPIILKRMKRRHNPEQVYDFFDGIRKTGRHVCFGADLIAGFPTETEEMFDNTYKMIKDLAIQYLHVFPFSPKSGTKAALMPQVEEAEKKRRARQLIELGKANLHRFNESQIGALHRVVIERDDIGRSEDFSLVKLNRALSSTDVMSVRISGYDGDVLLGE